MRFHHFGEHQQHFSITYILKVQLIIFVLFSEAVSSVTLYEETSLTDGISMFFYYYPLNVPIAHAPSSLE